MKKFVLALLLVLSSFATFAQTINWDIFNQAFSTQARLEDTEYGQFAILEHVSPIEGGENRQYFSGVGGHDGTTFWATRYELVIEDWVVIDGNYHIDQWLFVFNIDTKLIFNLHRQMVQRPDRIVLSLENIPESEVTYKKKAQDILKGWMNILK